MYFRHKLGEIKRKCGHSLKALTRTDLCCKGNTDPARK